MDAFDTTLEQLRAAAEPTRLRLLRLVGHEELTVTELTAITQQSQPGVSRHLKVLCKAGLVERQQEGAWVFYRSVASDAFRRLATRATGELTARDDDALRVVQEARAEIAEAYFSERAETWNAVRRLHLPTAELEAAIRDIAATIARRHGGRVERLLDLGTGTGRMLVLLDGLYDEGVGIDRSSPMLAVARAALHEAGSTKARVRRGDIFALDQGDGAADFVILHHVLHFLASPERAVAEAIRVSGAGGVLIADFAPHGLEALREAHAHRRLGFSDAEIADWAARAGRRIARTSTFPAPGPDGLTAKLWLIEGAPPDRRSGAQDEDRFFDAH